MGKGSKWGIYGGTICSFTHTPNKPQIPQGPSTGKINEQQNFTTTTSEPDNEQLYYKWDWGDNSPQDWIGPFQSNEICNSSHIWSEKGNYEIRVKAKDVNGAESEWSDPLSIKIPKNKQIQILFSKFNNILYQFPLLNQIFEL